MAGELIQTIIDALSKASPAVTANKAVNAIREGPWDSADPVIANLGPTVKTLIAPQNFELMISRNVKR
jgi:hypothetical protein